jgi:hypothetical protein
MAGMALIIDQKAPVRFLCIAWEIQEKISQEMLTTA